MAKTDFHTVDEYIAALPAEVRSVLDLVRSTIRNALPGADEVISYQMPGYRLHGHGVIAFAGWKHHFSLYGATDQLLSQFSEELKPYKIDKGTIRFPLSEPVPVRLIQRIVKFRAREAAERAKAKSAKSTKHT